MNAIRKALSLLLAVFILIPLLSLPAAADEDTDSSLSYTETADTLAAIGTAGTWNSCDVLLEGTLRYDYAFEVLEIENQRRVSLGLAPLVMDKDLMDHAMTRAIQCAMYWSHTQPDGSSFGYGSAVYMNAEIIACMHATPAAATNGWYNSASHYPEIIGKNYTGTGVGVFEINGTHYWVQLFNMLTPSVVTASDYADSVSVTRSVRVEDDNIYEHTTASLSDNTLEPGQTARFSVEYSKYVPYVTVYYDLPAAGLLYESSDESVCTVSEDGIVTAVSAGTATIKAWYPRYDYSPWTFTVTVSPPTHDCDYIGSMTTEPGCETSGIMTYTCSICRKSYTEEIASTGHTMSTEGEVTLEPGCLNFGKLTYSCRNCDYTETQLITPNGHNYDSGEITVMPTGGSSGTILYTCLSCGDNYTESLGFLPGDVKPNGTIDAADLVCLMNLILDRNTGGNPNAADVTADGIVDILDAIRLARHLADSSMTLG